MERKGKGNERKGKRNEKKGKGKEMKGNGKKMKRKRKERNTKLGKGVLKGIEGELIGKLRSGNHLAIFRVHHY